MLRQHRSSQVIDSQGRCGAGCLRDSATARLSSTYDSVGPSLSAGQEAPSAGAVTFVRQGRTSAGDRLRLGGICGMKKPAISGFERLRQEQN